MHPNRFQIAILTIIVMLTGCGKAADNNARQPDKVSGRVLNGYRVLPVALTSKKLHFTVYRGDYIKLQFDRSLGEQVFRVPDLGIEEKIAGNTDNAAYFKMKTTGQYPFSLGQIKGTIQVVAYQEGHYRDITAKEAADLIDKDAPLILDVRTTGEFKQGHIDGAVLVPLQELQKRIDELSVYKEREILVYCATGNRSTVASKILIDKGFKRIVNMKKGIVGWVQDKLPVTR